jgi:hypothetical protein
MQTSHEFYFILSRWTIETIFKYINDNGLSTDHCFVRVIHDKSGRETNRNIAFLPKEAESKLPELEVNSYKFQDHLLFREGFTQNFYVPFPKKLDISISDCRHILSQKLQSFVKTGWLKDDQFTIQIPFKSRQFGTLQGAMFVLFHDVDPKVLAMIRFVIDYSSWKTCPDNEDPRNYVMRCLWAKESRNRIKRRIKDRDSEA